MPSYLNNVETASDCTTAHCMLHAWALPQSISVLPSVLPSPHFVTSHYESLYGNY